MNYTDIKEFCEKNNIDFYYEKVVSSTMDFAKKDNNQNKNISIYLSEIQTKGKGRLNHKWISLKGNIFLTIKVFPKKEIKNFYEINILSSIAIKKALKFFKINNVLFKWPNDIFINNSKVGGILSEIKEIKNETCCLVGIGINLISSPKIKDKDITFIKKYNSDILIENFIIHLVKNFTKIYNQWNKKIHNSFINEYKKSLLYFNNDIKIHINNQKYIIGKFIDITKEGFLIIKSNNKKKIIYSGSVELIK